MAVNVSRSRRICLVSDHRRGDKPQTAPVKTAPTRRKVSGNGVANLRGSDGRRGGEADFPPLPDAGPPLSRRRYLRNGAFVPAPVRERLKTLLKSEGNS